MYIVQLFTSLSVNSLLLSWLIRFVYYSLCYHCYLFCSRYLSSFQQLCLRFILGKNHNAFIGLDCAPHWLWYWLLPVGFLINFSVIHILVRSFHICMPFGMCWSSSHRIRHVFYSHIMLLKRNMSIISLISAIGRSMNLNWASHSYRSNAITAKKSEIYNLKVGHIVRAMTVCKEIFYIPNYEIKLKIKKKFSKNFKHWHKKNSINDFNSDLKR